MSNKPKLDIEQIERLYEFGALMAYHVSYFDPMLFKTIYLQRTFSELRAKKELEEIIKSGFVANIYQELIKFDGEFAIKSD